MTGKAVSGIVVTLLLTIMLASALIVQPAKAEPETIYIRADGSVDPLTAPISTVDNVTYTFTDNINDSIVVERDNIMVDGAQHTVKGTGADLSKGIDLSGRTNVTVKNTQIENFAYGILLNSSSSDSIMGNNITAKNYIGIWLGSSCSNNSVSGNNITNNVNGIDLTSSSSSNSIIGNNITVNSGYGIWLDFSSSNSIIGNNVANNGDGIWLDVSSNNSISGNNVTANDYVGIEVDSSPSNTISGNNVANNVYGIFLDFSSSSNISGNTFTDCGLVVSRSYENSVEDNTVNGKPLVYLEDVTNYSVGDAGQVILVRCDSIRVENLNLSRASFGVQTLDTNNCIVSGNNMTNNYDSIFLDSSSNNDISGNSVISDSGWGISLYYSSDNTISGNNVAANNDAGISLTYSSNNDITGNSITAVNLYGILLDTSSSNSIIGNTITNSSHGIYFEYSSNETVYHNSFKNNSVQAFSTTSEIVWDDGYPSGGNYWSDYNGTDADSDGIGDVPYIIDANNNDTYPLMGWFSDFNATSENHVQTICNSTISDFQFNGTAIAFNVSGENGAAGFCRISIPTALMNTPYRVFVNGTEVAYDLLPFSSQTDSYLYFTYNTSTQQVIIMPELPTWTPILFALIALTVAVLVHKRRHPKTRIVASA